MTNPVPQSAFKKTNPTLRDVLIQLKKEIFLEMNCHAVATIQSFDPETQTVSATMNYKKTFIRPNETGVAQRSFQDYGVLISMPVVILSGGGATLTFPIAAGDTCMVLFNDRDLNNWIESGQVVAPSSNRTHSFADGIALIGVRPSTNPVADYDMDHALLAWGDAKLGITQSKVLIANQLYTLNGLLQDLCTQLQLLTVTGVTAGVGVSGVPVNAAAIGVIASQIGALLE